MYFYRQLLYISEEVADPHTAEAKNSIFFLHYLELLHP